MNCKICDIHHSKLIPMVVGETFHWVVRHSEFSKNAPGYLYIEPKRHVETYNDLKLYTITISEAVPHLHFHLVPRFEESPKGIEFLQLALSGHLPSTPYVQAELERVAGLFADN